MCGGGAQRWVNTAPDNKNERVWQGASSGLNECWLGVAGGGVIATGQDGRTRYAVVRWGSGSGYCCAAVVPKKR